MDVQIALTCKPRCWFQSSVLRTPDTGDLEHVVAFGSGDLGLRPQPREHVIAFGSGDLGLRPQTWEYSCAVWCNMNSETTLQFEVPSDSSGGLWMLFRSVYFEAGWTKCIIVILLLLLTVFPTFISHHSRVLFC